MGGLAQIVRGTGARSAPAASLSRSRHTGRQRSAGVVRHQGPRGAGDVSGRGSVGGRAVPADEQGAGSSAGAAGGRGRFHRAGAWICLAATQRCADAAAPLRVPAPQGRDPAAETFFDLKVSREELRLDRTALEGLLAAAADSGLSTDALETIASVQRSSALTQALRELSEKQATLRALRYRYTTGLPLVKRAMADISTLQRQTIPTMTRALIAQLAVREAALARRVDSAAGGLRRI